MVKFNRQRFVASFNHSDLEYAFGVYCWQHRSRYETFESAFWYDDDFFEWFMYIYLPSVYASHLSDLDV